MVTAGKGRQVVDDEDEKQVAFAVFRIARCCIAVLDELRGIILLCQKRCASRRDVFLAVRLWLAVLRCPLPAVCPWCADSLYAIYGLPLRRRFNPSRVHHVADS